MLQINILELAFLICVKTASKQRKGKKNTSAWRKHVNIQQDWEANLRPSFCEATAITTSTVLHHENQIIFSWPAAGSIVFFNKGVKAVVNFVIL